RIEPKDLSDDGLGVVGPGLELSIIRGPLWPALAAVRSRLRDAGGALPLPIRARADPPERAPGSGAGRGGRRILRIGAFGSADAGALPSSQRPHLPDHAARRPHGAVLHQR